MGQSGSKVVAAIDIGTTFSGYAYAFKDDIRDIYTSSQTFGQYNDRVPTVVLLDSNGKVDSFGHDAEQKYSGLLRDANDSEFRLFSRFKMELYSESNITDKTIKDEKGMPIKAVELFAAVIRYFKQLVLKAVQDGKVGYTENIEQHTLWILTVPAIWSDAARQIMKEAAVAAGIPEEKLRLVLEPEAAALFQQSQTLHLRSNGSLGKLPPGSKYIIADLGGGTVDICVHKSLRGGNVKELYRATGGDYGGMSVDNEFKHFYITIFGVQIWDKFKLDDYDEYLKLWKDFGDKKKCLCFSVQNRQTLFNIPNSLYTMLACERHLSLAEAVSRTPYSNFVRVNGQTLVCEKEIMEHFFTPSISYGIVPLLKTVVHECEDIDTIILVGGYSQSKYVTTILESAMSEMKIVHTKDPWLAVVKGAVLMGFSPKNIIKRKSRYTYGIALAVPFRERVHPENLKFTRNGQMYCGQVFEKIVEKDQDVVFGQKFKQIETNDTIENHFEDCHFGIAMFRSKEKNPRYCTEDEGCFQVGEIIVDRPVGGWPASIGFKIQLIAGDTEFKLVVRNKATGEDYRARIEFI